MLLTTTTTLKDLLDLNESFINHGDIWENQPTIIGNILIPTGLFMGFSSIIVSKIKQSI